MFGSISANQTKAAGDTHGLTQVNNGQHQELGGAVLTDAGNQLAVSWSLEQRDPAVLAARPAAPARCFQSDPETVSDVLPPQILRPGTFKVTQLIHSVHKMSTA